MAPLGVRARARARACSSKSKQRCMRARGGFCGTLSPTALTFDREEPCDTLQESRQGWPAAALPPASGPAARAPHSPGAGILAPRTYSAMPPSGTVRRKATAPMPEGYGAPALPPAAAAGSSGAN